MNNHVWSSPTATMNIANRVLRDVRRNHLASFVGIADLINPVARQYVQRGKLARGDLQPMFDRLVAGLYRTENIIDLTEARDSKIQTLRMSANEGYSVRFIQAITIDDEWLMFLGNELRMTRHQITLNINSTNFCVSAHLLSRYMQRGRKPYMEFLGTVVRPIRISAFLARHQANADNDTIVLPINGGLLAGDISVTPADDTAWPTRFIYNKSGRREEEISKDERATEWIINCWMRTFIDGDSLNQKKQSILEAIEDWERQHARGIEAWYQGMVFGTAQIRPDYDAGRMKHDVMAATNGCKGLINSAEWRDL